MSQDVRSRIWVGLIDANRLARYYCRLADKFSRWNRLAMMLVATLSVAALVSVFTDWYWWVGGLLSCSAAAIALWLSYADYSRRAGTAAFIGAACMDLTDDWERLWNNFPESDEAEAQIEALQRQINQVTLIALQQHGFDDDTLEERCAKEAEDYWTNVLTAQS